jgi:hypothetical protein
VTGWSRDGQQREAEQQQAGDGDPDRSALAARQLPDKCRESAIPPAAAACTSDSGASASAAT